MGKEMGYEKKRNKEWDGRKFHKESNRNRCLRIKQKKKKNRMKG